MQDFIFCLGLTWIALSLYDYLAKSGSVSREGTFLQYFGSMVGLITRCGPNMAIAIINQDFTHESSKHILNNTAELYSSFPLENIVRLLDLAKIHQVNPAFEDRLETLIMINKQSKISCDEGRLEYINK